MTTAREDEEQETRAIATFKPKFVLQGGGIQTYGPVRGKANEDPMIGITIRVPVQNALRYMGLITRLWQNELTTDLALSYVEPAEQRKHGLAEQASKNGSGHAPATGLEPIPIDRGSKKREPAAKK